VRREQVRLWRDQQIVELSLLPSRTPQQEEQLKTLVLERDFERRAQEEENEEENDMQYQKNNSAVQEVLRLQPNPSQMANNVTSQISVPNTRLKQVDIKTTPTNLSPTTSDATTPPSNEMPPFPHHHHHQQPPPIQPKSILKSTHNSYNSNPSSPSKHGKVTSFAPKIDTKTQNLSEITMNNTNANQMLSQLNKDMSDLAIEFQPDEQGSMPPPPPERGSSFAVMHQQKLRNSGTFQKLQFNEHPIINNTPHMNNINSNNNNNINNINNNNKYIPSNEHSPMLSPTTTTGTFTAQQMNLINNNVSFTRDNKRVSFHDHENNNINNNVDVMGEHEHDLSMIREDPNVSHARAVTLISQ
jgi:afadin